ncbi:carbohydrate ABC transporter permease [Sediminibacillus massiliensis]|uniref:carbohydrate ABC transporter permease n=1 Tax=Sediminibacillus massiliensis TaxID=1926277 RepID=UPI0009884524|nr:sugar ABC transporter permease [Sediminibacillus massiliensis]
MFNKKNKLSKMQRREALQGYVFVFPWVFGFIVFMAGPMLFSLYASFTDYDVTSRMNFIGLANFKELFTQDSFFWVSLYNTLYYVIWTVPITTVGAILLSVFLTGGVPGMRVFRTLYYLPAVLSGVAVFLLWMQLLAPSAGLINIVLEWFGIRGPSWLFDPAWTKPALILMKTWAVGASMLLYLAVLQNVPDQLYEAAELDGANAWHRFRHITLPMITPVIFFDIVTTTIGGFQVFQEALVMSPEGDGGPQSSMLFYNFYMYKQAFEQFNMGYASAMAWILFMVIMVITLLNLKVGKKWVYYEGEDK